MRLKPDNVKAHLKTSIKSKPARPAGEVDTVISLCSEEECPLFLGQARRLHWSLPDPAAVQGSDEERLVVFRRTRDELRRRIAAFLAGVNQ